MATTALFHGHLHDLFSHGLRALLADAALFLIFGGLSLIALIVVLVVLRGLFPMTTQTTGRRSGGVARRLRPLPLEGEVTAARLPVDPHDATAGWSRARDLPVRGLDSALHHVVTQGLGEPRILSASPDRLLVRIYTCRAHPAGPARHDDPPTGCGFARGFLSGVLEPVYRGRVEVHETACHGGTSPVCEFDIRLPGGV